MDEVKLNWSKRRTWFEPGKSLGYITDCLEDAKIIIRIATGFFTLRGWQLVRRHTLNKRTLILVGIDEPGEERARIALIEEIMRDLRTGIDFDRRQSVTDLISRIRSQQFYLVDARATDHHNKLYISDDKAAVQTSSNLTQKGLLQQVEGGNIITDSGEIAALIREFDDYFEKAQDLTRELLEILLKWLEFVPPWDIYLKTMLLSEDIKPHQSCYKKEPTIYQVDMIAQTLRQIREFDGSMLVASTGLGKTVVAVHVALHLKEERAIDNVMVISPLAVKHIWRAEMRSAGLPCEPFTTHIFDKKDSRSANDLELFDEISRNIEQQKWFLIIDESHLLRNRYKQDLFNLRKNPPERLIFKRLTKVIRKGNLKVLLLTGSPYAKNIDNINNQLYILPHRSQRQPAQGELFALESQRPWVTESADEFINLPVVSQLTTPHVAKYYGRKDEQGTFITFNEQKRYLPDILLHTINFPLILQREMLTLLNSNYLLVRPKNSKKSNNAIYKKIFDRFVKLSWASSPLSLMDILQNIADTPGGVNSYELEKMEFIVSRPERETMLEPIINGLKTLSQDYKLVALSKILENAIQDKRKVIIFCERRATVVYLHDKLTSIFPSLKIGATIEEPSEEEKKLQIKDSKEIQKLIERFAPRSNDALDKYDEDEYLDIFISTDAQGVGVNMQDAEIVINYDIDWTPIGPVQRAGRILRFWHEPRQVEIYTFVPTLTAGDSLSEIAQVLEDIQKRWKNLFLRHQESKKLIDMPVLTASSTQQVDMMEMASGVTIQSGELNLESLADLDTSPYYQHTAKLQANRDYASTLAFDLSSAKVYPGKTHLLYMLVVHKEQYRRLLYEPLINELTEPDLVTVLNLIECEPSTPIAAVDYELVEELSNACLRLFCTRNNISDIDVERVCCLYLKPDTEDDDLQELILSLTQR